MYMHFKDSDWHSTEGDKRDDLSSNAWFNKTQALAGDKKFIKKTGNWACEFASPHSTCSSRRPANVRSTEGTAGLARAHTDAEERAVGRKGTAQLVLIAHCRCFHSGSFSALVLSSVTLHPSSCGGAEELSTLHAAHTSAKVV
jgi:hypothetical protein